jgi:hypothetical protein
MGLCCLLQAGIAISLWLFVHPRPTLLLQWTGNWSCPDSVDGFALGSQTVFHKRMKIEDSRLGRTRFMLPLEFDR